MYILFSASSFIFQWDQFFEIFLKFLSLPTRENEINSTFQQKYFFIIFCYPIHMPLHLWIWTSEHKYCISLTKSSVWPSISFVWFQFKPLIRKCLSWYCSIETLLKTRMNLGLNILLIFMVSSSSNPSN